MGSSGSKATGVDRGITSWGLYPSSALILLGEPGKVPFSLLAAAPLFVSFGGLRSYPLLGF